MVGYGGYGADELLGLVREILRLVPVSGNKREDNLLTFKKDCADLVRRISILSHFLEEIRDNSSRSTGAGVACSGPSSSSSYTEDGNRWWNELYDTLNLAMKLLCIAGSFKSTDQSNEIAKKIAFQFQCMAWRLEKVLGGIPFDQLDISEEVQEQVALVRSQLRRNVERNGSTDSKMISLALALSAEEEDGKNGMRSRCSTVVPKDLMRPQDAVDCKTTDSVSSKTTEKPHLRIPEDFLCPISLEIMKDPVIVSTGQTYERSCIQRWIDTGNAKCPKTQQKLAHRTLTPNYVLRNLISQWCSTHNVKQPTGLTNVRIKRDGTLRDVNGDMEVIQAVIRNLSSESFEERQAAVAEVRSLSKRSTDNRILIAEAGAIPILVDLLRADDRSVQENAVTSILNLSIFENNKNLIMLAGAVPSIVEILRSGTVEARENAAATLFSLSLADENKIIIGASGAIPALVELLESGSARGKKDATTALFNLCIYHGNKNRAVRAGIVVVLRKMLTDVGAPMADEALTIMSVLSSNHEAKVAIVEAGVMPVLVDLLGRGQPRNRENAASILLCLCKRDKENLAAASRLGAAIPLTEIAENGTERAKRKAASLLEHLRRFKHY